MARTVKKLFDLEIDEVSLVDRSANQHASVAIAKRAPEEDPGMPQIYDAEGVEVYEDELSHGDVVYDETGQEFVFVDDDSAGEVESDGSSAELDDRYDDDAYEQGAYGEPEVAGVGKGWRSQYGHRLNQGRKIVRGGRARAQATRERAEELPGRARNYATAAGMQYRAIPAGGRAGLRYGGTAAVGGGTVHAGHRRRRNSEVGKSLGGQVLEELSKALNEADRDEVIAKAMDYVEEAREEAREAWAVAKALEEQRELEGYTELASSYQLPVNPGELGSILKRAAESLPRRDVETLDRIFSAFGEAGFDEIGKNGGFGTSEVMDQVQALAKETVGKADLSHEQAVVALFEANPDAYDQYLSER